MLLLLSDTSKEGGQKFLKLFLTKLNFNMGESEYCLKIKINNRLLLRIREYYHLRNYNLRLKNLNIGIYMYISVSIFTSIYLW